jgi:hypothetical protein
MTDNYMNIRFNEGEAPQNEVVAPHQSHLTEEQYQSYVRHILMCTVMGDAREQEYCGCTEGVQCISCNIFEAVERDYCVCLLCGITKMNDFWYISECVHSWYECSDRCCLAREGAESVETIENIENLKNYEECDCVMLAERLVDASASKSCASLFEENVSSLCYHAELVAKVLFFFVVGYSISFFLELYRKWRRSSAAVVPCSRDSGPFAASLDRVPPFVMPLLGFVYYCVATFVNLVDVVRVECGPLLKSWFDRLVLKLQESVDALVGVEALLFDLCGPYLVVLFAFMAWLIEEPVMNVIELFVGSRTRRRAPENHDFRVVCGNRVANITSLDRFFRGDDLSLRLHGYSIVGDVRLGFPVYCDHKTAHRVVKKIKNLAGRDFSEFCRGNFTRETKKASLELFRPVMHCKAALVFMESPFGSPTFLMIFLGWLFQVNYIQGMAINLFCVVMHLSLMPGDSFVYALCEEMFNAYFGIGPVVMIETATRFRISAYAWILPALAHLFFSYLPFWMRVPAHYVYNNVVGEYQEQCLASVDGLHLKHVDTISWTMDVVRKFMYKDYLGLAFSAGMAVDGVTFSWVKLIPEFESNPVLAIKNLREAFVPDESEGDVCLSWGTERYSFILAWIPDSIKRSPTFSKLVALIMILLSSKLFGGIHALSRVRDFFSSDDFIEGGDLFTTVATAMLTFKNALAKFVETGDWKSMFEMPKDVAFVENSAELLFKNGKGTQTLDEVLESVAMARSLIMSRKYSNNTVEHTRLVDKLRAYVDSKIDFLRAQRMRTPPFVIWLNGPPGTGKTTLINALVSYLAVRDGVARKPGDAVDLKVDDKYPTSSNTSPDARYLIMNDIPAIYTEFPKMDKTSLDLLLQQIIDSYPLYFRAAAVEDKGKIMNDVRYLIITSNHMNFKCPGETEKLQRRLEPALLVDMYVVDEKGRKVAFSEFGAWPIEKRNDLIRFKPLEVECKNTFITFTNGSEPAWNWSTLFNKLETKLEEKEISDENTKGMFQDELSSCPCGLPIVLHVGKFDDQSVLNPGKTERKTTFKYLTRRCDHTVATTDGFSMSAASILLCSSFSLLLLSYWLLGSYLTVFWTASCLILAFMNYEEILKVGHWLLQSEVRWVNGHLRKFCYLDESFRTLVHSLPPGPGVAVTKFLYEARRLWELLLKWLRDYGKYMSMAGAGLIAYKMFQKEAELLAKPIYPEMVDRATMRVESYSTERSFPLEKRREWSKGDHTMRTVQVTQGVALVDLERIVKANTEQVLLTYDDGRSRRIKMFFLTNEWVCFNAHSFLEDDGQPILGGFLLSFRETLHRFTRSSLKYDPQSEIVLYKHTFPCLVKTLMSYMPDEICTMSVDIVRVGMDDRFEGVAKPSLFCPPPRNVQYPALAWEGDRMEKGMCCEPVLAKFDGTTALVGLVAYRNAPIFFGKPVTGCSLISKAWFERLIADDPYPVVNEVELLGFPAEVGPLSINAQVRNVPSSYLVVVGSIPGPTKEFKSSIRKSRLYDDVAPKLSAAYAKPRKLAIDDGKEYQSAFMHAFKNVNLDCNLVEEETEAVVAMMLERVASATKVSQRKVKLSPLSFEEAIFGAPELGIERIDFKTSAGPLLKALGVKNKYDMFAQVGEDQYVFKDEVMERVMELDKLFKKRQVPAPFVDMVPKDEVRLEEKIAAAKIRLFCVLCAAYNLYIRMYLMPLIAYLMQFREDSECYGSMNAGSAQWNELANRLRREFHFFFDMDFSAFDASHGPKSFSAAARFFYRLALRLGYCQEAAEIVYLIIISFRWQVARSMADVFLKFKGMPSGVIFTLIMNSFVNSFLLRVAYKRLVGDDKFDERVITANVGDDNVNSVSDEIKKEFNMITIAVEYRKCGYVATPAKKNERMQIEIPFEELSFLKRRFDWSEEMKSYLAPIEKDSIYKAFCFEKSDAGIPPPERLRSVALGAQREAFLHGREFFEEFKSSMSEIYGEHRLVWEDLSFETLKEEYSSGLFKTFAC